MRRTLLALARLLGVRNSYLVTLLAVSSGSGCTFHTFTFTIAGWLDEIAIAHMLNEVKAKEGLEEKPHVLFLKRIAPNQNRKN